MRPTSRSSTPVRLLHAALTVSRRPVRVLATLLLLGLPGTLAGAQPPDDVARRPSATRASLEAFVQERRQAGRGATDAQAEAVQRRLREGDFIAGEQVVLRVAGQRTLSDTFTVQPGLVLTLPGLAPVSLHGLLRSELQPHLSQHIARFVLDAQVDALTLVRVGVLGEVRNPGFYRVATSTPLSDVLMAAGGPTTQADLNRVSVRRASLAPNEKAPAEPVALTRALDDLAVQNGDQLHVGTVKKRNWAAISQTATVIVGLVVAVATLTAR